MKEKVIIEDANSSEISSDNIEPFLPTKELQNLEVDESVYSLLEYIEVDWPSQTIATKDNAAFLATNPSKGKKPCLVRLDFSQTNNYKNVDKFIYDRVEIDENINRMRIRGNQIIAISENKFLTYDLDGIEKYSFIDKFSYGLAHNEKYIATGKQNGEILVFDSNMCKKSYQIHEKKVESICIDNEKIYSGGCDFFVKAYDMKSETEIFSIPNKNDVNAVDLKNNMLVFGDDAGQICVIDVRKTNSKLEEILWHKTPISMIKWKTDCEFYTLSDEQLCIWDTEFEEDWEYHKWLKFVHSGHKYFKDVDFIDDIILTTSIDGVCLFSLNIEADSQY
ncbi:hypothetical protein EDEG_03847 [Edhazardia aedis USNM 41457]|uniref:Anaphase-promoting complex subunit 4 WD40 domain-containing protein n=1 Tax=Edhazardia aedis (strain USNM 41457) TaxID=1003232 RepID=J9D202_EDHAE|nr:hypothetical protein EDEG_03847 [Edhazardia aedis USNM 41457]|eukprot:EJW01604.1 hypothetical protein EDEG_03847 [Edhazardia aedis USNM 41457]